MEAQSSLMFTKEKKEKKWGGNQVS